MLLVVFLLVLDLAILLDQDIKGEGFFRSLFLFPMAISYIVTGVVWRWLMNPATGITDERFKLAISHTGVGFFDHQMAYHPILGDCLYCPSCHLANVWLYHGAISGRIAWIPDELREAAGWMAPTKLQIYRHIILPLFRPVTLSAMIILGHISLKVFDLIVAIAGKQLPLDVPAIYMWQITFDGYFFGRGAAIGILLLMSVAVLIIPYLHLHPENGGRQYETHDPARRYGSSISHLYLAGIFLS